MVCCPYRPPVLLVLIQLVLLLGGFVLVLGLYSSVCCRCGLNVRDEQKGGTLAAPVGRTVSCVTASRAHNVRTVARRCVGT